MATGLPKGATSATGEANLRLLATDTATLRANADKNKYPSWVRKGAVKVLVQDEAEHRREVPADFAPKAAPVVDKAAK